MPLIPMRFEDFDTQVEAGGRIIPVRLTREALKGLWGADSGPQTAQGLFDKHRAEIEEMIADKLVAGDLLDGSVVLGDADFDF